MILRKPQYALSIKQPWAALLVAGLKTIEIRKWATTVRGTVYIHAASKPDPREEGWAYVTEELRPLAALGGGIIGTAELSECLMYRTPQAFTADVPLHRNDPSWFLAPRLFGFRFRNPVQVPFHRCRGQVKFFTVTLPETP